VRRRRDADHHPQALSLAGCAALLAALVAAGPALAAGGNPKIARDGSVHRVVAGGESGVALGSPNPILHIEQSPSGETVTRVVANDGWGMQPALEIDALTDEPVVVWARLANGETDIHVSRYDGAHWSAPLAVTDDAAEDGEPSILIGSTLIHVIWQRAPESGGSSRLYVVALDRISLAPASAPSALPTAGVSVIALQGGTRSAAIGPAPDERLFVGETQDSESGRILIVFGIREEPMPVGYRQAFLLPPDIPDVADARAEWSGSRVVLSFVSDGQLCYTILDDGAWTEMRRVDLGPVSTAEARQQIADMLERVGTGSLE